MNKDNIVYKLNRVRIQLVEDAPFVSCKPINTYLRAVEEVGKYLCKMDREVLCVINLNTKQKPINCNIVSVGSIDQSIAVPSDILKSSILSNAASIIMMHNHPSGDVFPSKADIEITDRLGKACRLLGLTLFDHIIVGNRTSDGCFSFGEGGMLTDCCVKLASTLGELDFSSYVAESFVAFEKGGNA